MSDLFSPDDPVLTQDAPHEPPLVARLHLAGWPSQFIVEEFRLRGTKFVKQIADARLAIDEAVAKGRPIHNVLIPKEDS